MTETRCLIEQLHGHWTAWRQTAPETGFGGANPGEALDRLLQATPDLDAREIEVVIRGPESGQ